MRYFVNALFSEAVAVLEQRIVEISSRILRRERSTKRRCIGSLRYENGDAPVAFFCDRFVERTGLADGVAFEKQKMNNNKKFNY